MNRLEKLVKLGMSETEAKAVLASDRQVDKMTKMQEINSDLSASQKQVIKQLKNVKSYAKTTRKPRETKKNETKMEIIAAVVDCLRNKVDGLSVENVERVVKFTKNGENYTITLTKNRK